MGALTSARVPVIRPVKEILLPLAHGSGMKAWRHGIACWDTATATIKPGAASTTLVPIGYFLQDVDNSAGSTNVLVRVELFREIFLHYFDSVTGGGAVTSSNLGQDVLLASDHEVTTVTTGNSKIGRVFDVNGTDGVGVWPYASGE